MMYEGKHIHFSPVDNRPLCSYSGKLCRQRRVNNYAFCIRHILEDKAAPFKQCVHVAKYNNQKCTNPIPSNEDREFCNSHMQVAGMAPKKERKHKKEKDHVGPAAANSSFSSGSVAVDGKMKFAERVRLLKSEDLSPDDTDDTDDPYTFLDATPPPPPSPQPPSQPTPVSAANSASRDSARHYPSGGAVALSTPSSTMKFAATNIFSSNKAVTNSSSNSKITTAGSRNINAITNNKNIPNNHKTISPNNRIASSINKIIPTNNSKTIPTANNKTIPTNNKTIPTNNRPVPTTINKTMVTNNKTTLPTNSNRTINVANKNINNNKTTLPTNSNRTINVANKNISANKTAIGGNAKNVIIPNNKSLAVNSSKTIATNNNRTGEQHYNHHNHQHQNNVSSEIHVKLEPTSRSNCVSADTKCGGGGGGSVGGGQAKSSKSVNRLEARIARNKILDKLKKNRTSSLAAANDASTDSPSSARIHCSAPIADNPRVSETISSVVRASAELQNAALCSVAPPLPSSPPSALAGVAKTATGAPDDPTSSAFSASQAASRTLSVDVAPAVSACASVVADGVVVVKCDPDRPSRRTSLSVYPSRCAEQRAWKRPDAVSGAVKLVQRLWEDKVTLRADLFPLGFDGTDSDSDDSDVEVYQRHWFASPSDQDSWDDGKNGVLLRSIKQNFAKSDFRRQCAQMRQSQNNLMTTRSSAGTLAKALVSASKCQPLCTARLLDAVSPKSHRRDPKTIPTSTALSKQKCCYSNDVTDCPAIALPYTRHCIKHIMYNVDQLLFEHCTAKFADNTQCCIPVFDVCHELPLCVEHARKRDNYSKMSAEPKPKKPRKKTKPSALTRPPKRGKKKKRQNMKLTDVTNLSHESSTSQDLLPSAHFNAVSSSIGHHNTSALHPDDVGSELDGPMDGDLGSDLVSQLSPGTIDKSLELPMDAAELANQASRLLEEHDFTEVLSKIPDEAFTELFNESKNGDLCHSREADELARALAAVDKDAKFSHEDQLELQEALLHGDHLGSAMDHTLSDLVSSAGGLGLDSLHVITSSLSTSDLNSITGLLNSMSSMSGAESTLAHLPLLSDLVSTAGHLNHHNHNHHHNHHNHHHHHSDMMAAGGFSLRHDGGGIGSDQFVSSMSAGSGGGGVGCGDAADSLVSAQWFNDYAPIHHNGLANSLAAPISGGCGLSSSLTAAQQPHSHHNHTVTSAAASKYVSQHSLAGLSSGGAAAKGYLHNPYGGLSGVSGGAAAAFLDNSQLNPLLMELTENSAESVS